MTILNHTRMILRSVTIPIRLHTRTLCEKIRNFSDYPEVRVRFAPSPTGNLHLGGLRTALYNYIFAKKHNGKFILRIEDTDQSRIVPNSAEEIEETLNWAGLNPDESPNLGGKYGPYMQSDRLDLYKERAEELLRSNLAYKCFCSPTRLELLRKHQMRNREKPRYDGKCKTLNQDEIKEKLAENNGLYVIRFKLQPEVISFNDLIFGSISNNLVDSLESHPVILKSDSYPTYHFANVVDDHEMKISHVLRGSEWISSTAIHLQLYQAFGWHAPTFAHFPLITMSDGSKMSKRYNHSHIRHWRDAGYSPKALLNFLTNMGGGVPKEKQDQMYLWNLQTIIEQFEFSRVTSHPGSADLERFNKYNQKDLIHTWKTNPESIIKQLKGLLKKKGLHTDLDDKSLTLILDQFITRIVTLNDLISEEFAYVWNPPTLTWSVQEYLERGRNLEGVTVALIEIVKNAKDVDKDTLDDKLRLLSENSGMSRSEFMRFLRKLLTNSSTGQPVYEIFSLLSKSRLILYLEKGLAYILKSKQNRE